MKKSHVVNQYGQRLCSPKSMQKLELNKLGWSGSAVLSKCKICLGILKNPIFNIRHDEIQGYCKINGINDEK